MKAGFFRGLPNGILPGDQQLVGVLATERIVVFGDGRSGHVFKYMTDIIFAEAQFTAHQLNGQILRQVTIEIMNDPPRYFFFFHFPLPIKCFQTTDMS